VSGGRRKGGSKAVQEFLSEAQEFVETLSRNLLSMDGDRERREPDPEKINEVFRGWHTLKGLAGTFGVDSLARLAHREEYLLDDIRMGRAPLTPEILDILLESVEAAMKVLAAVGETGDPATDAAGPEIERLLARLEGHDGKAADAPGDAAEGAGGGAPPGAGIQGAGAARSLAELIGADVIEVLTEFEEHRLKTNLDRGRPLYRLRTKVEMQAIDTELEAIKKSLKPVGEIITYLPSMDSGDTDNLDLDVLLVLEGSREALDIAVSGFAPIVELLVPAREVNGPSRNTLPPPAAPEAAAARSPAPPVAGPVEIAVRGDDAPPVPAPEQALSLRSVSRSVRVDIGKLDRLMNVVGELNIIRGAIAKVSEGLRALAGRRELAIELYRVSRGFERRLAELREGILEVRMVPISQMFDRLARLARKVSRDLGKEIHLLVSGGETEVDKLIIEELSDPLMHIIRNAIDHGIEGSEERRAAGKLEAGTVALTAYQKGNHVLIEIEDDGAGIDGEGIVEAAVARGMLSAEQAEALSPREVLHLIFLPGITTASQATEISGRGVGMDVVKTNIAALGGVVEVQSDPGIGTKFTITMPVTLAIIPALLVEVLEGIYAIPLNTVAEAVLVSEGNVHTVLGAETMTLRGQTLPLHRLDAFFGRPRPGPIPAGSYVVVAALGQRRLGLVIDALVGQQDVVIKPLGPSLDGTGGLSGATDIGNQRLTLVLDTAAVIEEWFSTGEGSEARAALPE
jgi:two-component system chemotaxis sensor kinase CheA